MFFKESLDRKIDKLSEKIDQHSKDSDRRLDNIEKVLIIQEQNLKDHMKRSEHLEEIVEQLKSVDISQLKKHVNMVEGGLKLLGVLGLIVSIIAGLTKIFNII